MVASAGPGLTADDVQRWLRGLQLFHVERLVLVALFVLRLIVNVASAPPRCTVADPALCGPSQPADWAFALSLATLVFLVCAPALGCVGGIVLGVLGAASDPTADALGWWAAVAVASLFVLAHLLLIRVRQHRVTAARQDRWTLPGRTRPPTRVLSAGPGLFIGVTAAVGIVFVVVYQHQLSVNREHLQAAIPLNVVVQSLNRDNQTLDLVVPGQDYLVSIDVQSTGIYRVGQTVPVLADLTGSSPWVRLVAEPDDPGWGLSFAVLALLLAGVAALRPARVW